MVQQFGRFVIQMILDEMNESEPYVSLSGLLGTLPRVKVVDDGGCKGENATWRRISRWSKYFPFQLRN